MRTEGEGKSFTRADINQMAENLGGQEKSVEPADLAGAFDVDALEAVAKEGLKKVTQKAVGTATLLAGLVTGLGSCLPPAKGPEPTSGFKPVSGQETIPPKPPEADAFPSVPATGEQGPTERYPWSGSSKIKLEYNPGTGGDNQNVQLAGEITLPESVVEDIVGAAAEGRIVNLNGKPVIGIENQGWILVGYSSFGADGKERQWAVAYSAQGNDLLLPFKYQTKDKGAVTVLAFISPEPEGELWVYPDLGVSVRESDPDYGLLDKAIFRREIKGSFGEGKPIAINPEAFPPSLHFSGLTEAEASKPVSYFVEKEKPDGTVTYEQRTWNPTVDPRKDPSQAIPENLEVLAMETVGKKEWVKVVLTGPTGQPEVAFVKWATSLELVGDASQIRPLTEIPAELLALEQASEKPVWLAKVSNTEAKFNPDKKAWEYYSTAEGEEGQYIVSVKQNEKGEFFFYNFAEELDVTLHSELFSDATFNEIIEAMKKTGAVKYIPCSRVRIKSLRVQTYPKFDNEPLGLIIYPSRYPLDVYYPYLKGGQANPGHPLMAIILADVNQGKEGWETRWVQVYALDNSEKAREMSPSESLVGGGILAQAGTPIMRIKNGLIKILGRQEKEYKDVYNRMFLDSFARDSHGRLMLPN